MKVAVIGANGQLGSDLCRELISEDLVPLTHSDIEITNANSVKTVLGRYNPDVIINTAAYIRVDDCETNPDRALQVNALGAGNVAAAALRLGARLVHLSTDYVFGGEDERRTTPYTESDIPVPPNTYGKSKLAGENSVRDICPNHFIIRTSGLFGATGARDKSDNFVETTLRLARERDEMRIVDDQVFSPTYARDLAKKITRLITTEDYGTFHITNRGACSWYEFASRILKLAGLNTPVTPITSDQYPQKARRPRFSVLDNHHLRLLGIDDMPPWPEALRDYMKEKSHLK